LGINDDFKPSGPGLWMFPSKDHKSMVDDAEIRLLSIPQDPYIYEALQSLLWNKHKLVSPIKKGGRRPSRGGIAKMILEEEQPKHKSLRGGQRKNRPNLKVWLAGIDRLLGKRATKNEMVKILSKVVKSLYPFETDIKRQRVVSEFVDDLLKERDRQRHRN